jgi:hypothetical protein
MRIAVSREKIAQRAGELLAKPGGVIFFLFTFSSIDLCRPHRNAYLVLGLDLCGFPM